LIYYSVKGKTVRNRRGPAAVTGDEACTSHCILFLWEGAGSRSIQEPENLTEYFS